MLREVMKATEKYVIDNSPTLLTGVAIAGATVTAYLTGKATFRAAKIIDNEQDKQDYQELGHQLDNKEKMKLVWKEYIPPALVLTGTVGAMVMSNSISVKRLAGLAAAYKLSEKQFDEYRDKVLEKLGVKEEKDLRREINKEHYLANPPSDDIQTLSLEEDVIFLEAYSGRYFRSKMHIVKAAENELNRKLIYDPYVTLSDFYDILGLARTQFSSEIGWCMENPPTFDYDAGMADGGSKPIVVLEYSNRPGAIRDYQAIIPTSERKLDHRGVDSDRDYPGVH